MAGPALLLAGLAVTGSHSDASFALAGLTVSAAVGGPMFGALLDRARRPGRVLCGALAMYALGLTALLPALGRLPLAATVAVAAVAGLFAPAVSAGWSSQLPGLAPSAKLPRAHTWDAMTFDVAGLTAPALVGALAATAGAPAAVVGSVALLGAALPAAWRLPERDTAPSGARSRTLPGGPVAAARAILRAPPLARATAISVICCVAQGALVACTPQLGVRVFGAAGWGVLLLSVLAASALSANALLARRRPSLDPDAVVRVSALVQACGLLLTTSGRPTLVVAGFVVLGLADGPQLAALFLVRHREAPHHLRAQVFAAGASLKITGFALGSALAGVLAPWSLSGTLAVASGAALLAAVGCGRARSH